MTQLSLDRKFMQRALALAQKGHGRTSPNPMVGCVIVKSGKVVGEGWHKFYGGDHAEINALKEAGRAARGSTMYITLEPCSHWGKTPPCAEAIIKAGVKRVVAAMPDPNPINNGRSFKLLQKAGIPVTVGVQEQAAEELNVVFIKYMIRHLPFVVAKTAQTLDGKIATRSGDSKWITSEKTRAFARQRRDDFDAILVGVNTVLADDPRLDAPTRTIRKIVLDSRLRTPVSAKILKVSEPGQVIIATTIKAPLSARKRLEQKGARVVVAPLKGGQVDLKWLFKELAKEGIASILIEGGSCVIGHALKAGLVDRLHLYIAPMLIGDQEALSAVAGFAPQNMRRAIQGEIFDLQIIGRDIFLEVGLNSED